MPYSESQIIVFWIGICISILCLSVYNANTIWQIRLQITLFAVTHSCSSMHFELFFDTRSFFVLRKSVLSICPICIQLNFGLTCVRTAVVYISRCISTIRFIHVENSTQFKFDLEILSTQTKWYCFYYMYIIVRSFGSRMLHGSRDMWIYFLFAFSLTKSDWTDPILFWNISKMKNTILCFRQKKHRTTLLRIFFSRKTRIACFENHLNFVLTIFAILKRDSAPIWLLRQFSFISFFRFFLFFYHFPPKSYLRIAWTVISCWKSSNQIERPNHERWNGWMCVLLESWIRHAKTACTCKYISIDPTVDGKVKFCSVSIL